jgi:hypothetical protein
MRGDLLAPAIFAAGIARRRHSLLMTASASPQLPSLELFPLFETSLRNLPLEGSLELPVPLPVGLVQSSHPTNPTSASPTIYPHLIEVAVRDAPLLFALT